jgi:hypothetical protein
VTPAEASVVLTLLSQVDQRTIGEADARGWATALTDIRGIDAAEVAQSWYTTHAERPMPADIRREVKALRAARLDRAGPAPLPPDLGVDPDDTSGYRDALRAWQRQVADGNILDRRPEIPLPRRDMRAIEGTFQDAP